MELKERSLVDINTKQVYSLQENPDYIVSDPVCAVETASSRLLVIPPGEQGECFILQVAGEPPSLKPIRGSSSLNGKALVTGTATPLSPGAFVTLGRIRTLQYVSVQGSVDCSPPVRRVLPPTPGKVLDQSPPSKPLRHKHHHESLLCIEPTLNSSSDDYKVDTEIRQQLQRIAAEVSARLVGYEGRSPPPPYEQVGNSIGYQLLHQQKHKMVTSKLINNLYPALKENELKDPSLLQVYSSFLQTYNEALEKPAALNCMLPADLPTCDFMVDMLLHLCCMPHMTALAEKQGELWGQLIAILSQSQQNQFHMAAKRHPTKFLSCMHLNMMASKVRFQQYGWTVLANTVGTCTPQGGKPVLSEPSFTLALSLTECQLASNSSDISLVVAIVGFLSQVATAAKLSVSSTNKSLAYKKEQAVRILALFQEKLVLRQVMKCPPHLRSDPTFEQVYSVLVKALVPVRGQASGVGVVRTSTSHSPKRSHPSRRSTVGGREREEKPQQQQMTSGTSALTASTSLTDVLTTKQNCTTESGDRENNPIAGSSQGVTSGPKKKFASCSDLLDNTSSSVDLMGGHEDHALRHVITSPDLAACENSSVGAADGSNESLNYKTSSSSGTAELSFQNPVTPLANQDTPLANQDTPLANQDTSLLFNNTNHKSESSAEQATSTEKSLPHSALKEIDTTPPSTEPPPPTPSLMATTSPHHSAVDASILTISPSPTNTRKEAVSPPLTPNTANLAEDVQELLDSLSMPLRPVSPAGGLVKVPTLSRYNRYYRHSYKRASYKQKDVADEGRQSSVLEKLQDSSSSSVSSYRLHWGEVTAVQGHEESALFEKSGKFLSSSHSAIEEVLSGHPDISQALQERVELVKGVLLLWGKGKGLQAATNLLQGCFSEGCEDTMMLLFVDTLNCFISFQSPWTLAVCLVLLPPLRLLVTSQMQKRFVKVVGDVILMIVHRFSDLILATKTKRNRRLSSTVACEQQLVCYRELHSIHLVVYQQLNTMSSNMETEVREVMNNLHLALGPFRQQHS